MSIDLALVGATGLVGEAILEQLAHRDLPVGELFVLASENSEGKSLRVGKKSLQVRKAEDFDFSRVQLAVFAAGAAVSQELAPRAADAGALVLDLSPAFRYEPDVPLLVAGVNDEQLGAARERNIVAAADAATVQLLLALKPLMALGDLTRVTVTQMQSASSSGRVGVERLARQSARLLNGLEASEGPESQYAFNMLPMAGRRQDNGYTSEELKLMLEARRVLGQPQLAVDVSCVQVPVFHGLSQTVVVQGTMPITLAQAEACWQDAPGLQMDADDEADGASPVRQIRADLGVRIARVREDIDGQGDLSFWTVADNIKTGAAYNAVLLVEKLLKDYL
ncbi:aspartate-semialdehyde dehydrogenase [Alloalcanivorax venustensis]|jgi:aspartate-semialdehyde dehydrogenase|uniref:Aspartate-semialdehyde dehydrogenase n=1 Tax=Alloalcanivorax venustensis ISO4 TaxID=1177184 RepID=A0ABS0AJR7_9GAMM|nr:aspartate-semialdehyde dehydrogenase [Alloalcanivorax venustensis]KXJ49293.1 MAG: aspartate-semialdehyde dehydrogenase [Alcanivorax sp. Nap_24]MAQ34728.1 aspartate-semialdehyde dehydrogenase [Alcanivorax sp.]MCH9783916.1 aspartate-semialdehyde dehydrogenase [Gammaproteobacteria bacterium]MEA3260223.1 aspartate-semialdehyde dehydrogenase [Pseudomonadota bacterium]SMO76111.1 aspartate semialdehyde dehydrogenase [Alcanivorax sp. DSM 26295]|tara:strand:- start:52827 stop:53837 length:1011 start_codon:yes stop_codon:yes gene_type:complete